MSERAPYSRVYWMIGDDPKFDTIYDDDHHLAAWLRLLLIADQAHPASAHLPANVRRSSVKALADVGLVDLAGSRYRIHGLNAERSKRRDSATRLRTGRDPDGDQLPPKPDPSGPYTPGRSRERDETRQAEDEQTRAPDAAVSLERRTGRFPSKGVLSWLDDLAREAGTEERLATLIDETPMNGVTSVKDYLDALRDKLRRTDHEASRAELAEEQRKVAKGHEPVRLIYMPDDTTPEEAERLAAEWEAEFGRKPA